MVLLLSSQVSAIEPCRINIVDEDNGWPVPLVELRTTHNVKFVSDNAGIIAFDLPELLGRKTWFSVEGHGYSVPKDGFGYRGVRLTPRSGETLTVKVQRQLPAKRLGRITGGGIFGESQKLGLHLDWHEQGILGCDSVQNAVHNGKLFWGWGDTVLSGYPLGRFHMIGATTERQPLKSFEPPVHLRFDYFVDEAEIPRNVAQMPGKGPTWLGGYASLPDKGGRHRLVATYAKIEPPLDVYEYGLCVWDDEQNDFKKLRSLWKKSDSSPLPPDVPQGHPVFWKDDAGQQWILFGDPFPSIKCPATFEAWTDPETWQKLTPQASVPVRQGDTLVKPHRGAIAWNSYRKKWVVIFTEYGGKPSLLGELWLAESDAPSGPWENAVKVVTHSKYTFYNPQLHSEWTSAESPMLLFEATYTKTFSKTSESTPRYDYNQVLYRLDLDDPAFR
ncbi:MAG: hypothetical protein HQ518_32045 [Rhodopirellula sp.]|nr:hypothetical protein [Rhodopirellula sp.]